MALDWRGGGGCSHGAVQPIGTGSRRTAARPASTTIISQTGQHFVCDHYLANGQVPM